MANIDLNCDMGEGCGNDAALMKYISSANIACGYHAGSEDIILRTMDLAMENGVAIGAHPGYRDRENFGRIKHDLTPDEVYSLIAEQLEIFARCAESRGATIAHVKPHGALYNFAAQDEETASAPSPGRFMITIANSLFLVCRRRRRSSAA